MDEATRRILDAYEERSARPVARRQRATGTEFVIGRREGPYIWNLAGDHRLLDCATTGGVHSLGHRHPEVLAALRGALDDGLDGGIWTMPSAAHLALQDALAAYAPGQALNRSVLTLSASAANDLALLCAFRTTGRRGVVAYRHGYHGHGGFSAQATGAEDEGIARHYAIDQQQVRFFERYGDLSEIDALIDARVAAVILEPMDYETWSLPPPGFLPALVALCRSRGAKLIFDETRTGLGRSGRVWMCEHSAAVPDMLVTGKGLSGGLYPVGALLMTQSIHEDCINGHEYGYASSLGGNEIASVVGCKVLEIVSRPPTLAHIGALQAHLRDRLATLCQRHQGVFAPGTVLGGVVTLRLLHSAHAKTIGPALFARGVLCHSVSTLAPHVVKFLPVLTGELTIVDEMITALDSFAHASTNEGSAAT